MIKVGTVCYLTGDHSRAGQCCTVIGPLQFVEYHHQATGTIAKGWGHDIALASGERSRASSWFAFPHELVPIAPPGLTEREDKREKAPA